MDKDLEKANEIKPTDDLKKDEDISLPSVKENNVSEDSNNELPKIEKPETSSNIEKPEASSNEEGAKKSQNILNSEANFAQIFNVESEEKSTLDKNVNNENEINNKVSSDTANTLPKDEEKANVQINKAQFNSEEKLLYEIKPEKEGNPIVVLLFFIFLIGFVVLLPVITKNNREIFKFIPFHNNSTTPSTEENDGFYDFGSLSTRITLGDLEFNNFVSSKQNNEYYLSFTLTNTGRQPYLFDKKYYIVLYDQDTILYRALIHSYDPVSALGAKEVSLIISERAYQRVNKFKIEEIDTSRYPEVNTTESDGDYQVLTCNYLNDEMKYYFLNEKLTRFVETYAESSDNSFNFEANKNNYRNLSDKYKNIENFNSTFVETASQFTMINDVELSSIPDKVLADLQVYRFFKYNENKNVVAFELEGQGYTCR